MEQTTRPPTDEGTIQVLLVEDDEKLARLTSRYLQEYGLLVTLARTGLEALPSLLADPVLLRRVLDNVLDNAGKYSEPGTTVRLSAHPVGASLQVEVADEGIGIDAADLPRISTPFFRTDRSRARATGGVGLGLALVRRIVDAHGGTLALESQPGVGTTVRVNLPAEQAAEQELPARHLS